MRYRLARYLRVVTPRVILDPVLNVARLLRAIISAPSNSLAELGKLHEMYLTLEKTRRNVERLMNREQPTLNKQKGGQRTRLLHQEASIYSQNGEDGLLSYIFSITGVAHGTLIEFGAGGYSSNTANLILNHGWKGLLIDGGNLTFTGPNAALARIPNTDGIKCIQQWLTPDNINDIFQKNGMTGEIDLLSIDIDGNDYWVWKAIKTVNPRVVVCEYNASFGSEESVTIEFDAKFDRYRFHPQGWYYGASLTALARLANEKGYILVGCESSGVNAFFIRKDLESDDLREVTPQEAFFPDSRRSKIMPPSEQLKQVMQYPIQKV